MDNNITDISATDIAIIGMAGRFPRSKNINQLWEHLIKGECCITHYTNEELIACGINESLLKNPQYIKARGEMEDIDLFDASFFGINPTEAEMMDPQHRFLLECAWEALEDAGYDPARYNDRIGVYAGEAMNTYLLLNVYPKLQAKMASLRTLQAAIGNDKDSLTTTISYRLNLTGPSITIQTSSSTSLVAVCIACQGLLSYNCDIALAGGVAIAPPQKGGYLYEEGGILSPDGYCRTFDAQSGGFVPGYGMGLVVLKRLEEAIADKDTIYAVIKGWAINNDGANKVSYSAPSIDAQSQVILEALMVADVPADTVTYIECHGTGTKLGDPIEVTALNQAFHTQTDNKHYCAIGSVKTNLGHLDNAAGVTGLIKAALCCKTGIIPPSLHFQSPNPKIDWNNSPFYVNDQLMEWNPTGFPRRAGITSLGMGGTNAHVIIEEPPILSYKTTGRIDNILLLSARTETALTRQIENLARMLTRDESIDIHALSYTLQVGRRYFSYRKMVYVSSATQLKKTLQAAKNSPRTFTLCTKVDPPVVFMFPGQGSLYPGMAESLYENEGYFREQVDKCALILEPLLHKDIRSLIFPHLPRFKGTRETDKEMLYETVYAQPALFVIQYALAQLWIKWGICPRALIGHSIGEYTAACLAGALSLKDALFVVAERSRLMQQTEAGTMAAVGLGGSELEHYLTPYLNLAALNSPRLSVVSGSCDAVESLKEKLKNDGLFAMSLKTSHGFHSFLMEPVLDDFKHVLSKVTWKKPAIPLISCLHGRWAGENELAEPDYWVKHLRQTVLFSQGVKQLLNDTYTLFLEAGPGNTLCTLVKQHASGNDDLTCIPSLPRHDEKKTANQSILEAVGQLWMAGKNPDWDAFYPNERPRRIPLPTYPFESCRHWIEPDSRQQQDTVQENKQNDNPEIFQSGKDLEMKFSSLKPEEKAEFVEETLYSLWKDCMGNEAIGLNDNFFEIGGDSILLVQIYNKLNVIFDIQLQLVDLFDHPSINMLNKRIIELLSVKNTLSPDSTADESLIENSKEHIQETQENDRAKAIHERYALRQKLLKEKDKLK